MVPAGAQATWAAPAGPSAPTRSPEPCGADGIIRAAPCGCRARAVRQRAAVTATKGTGMSTLGRNERAGRGAQGPHHSAEKPQKCSTRGCPITMTTTPHPCRSGTAALPYEHRAELLLSAAGETAGAGQRAVPQQCTFQGQQTPSTVRRPPTVLRTPTQQRHYCEQ